MKPLNNKFTMSVMNTEKFLCTTDIYGYKPLDKVAIKRILGFYNGQKDVLLVSDNDANIYKLVIDNRNFLFHTEQNIVYVEDGEVTVIADYKITHMPEEHEGATYQYMFPLYSSRDMFEQDTHLARTARGMEKALRNEGKDSTRNKKALDAIVAKLAKMEEESEPIFDTVVKANMSF